MLPSADVTVSSGSGVAADGDLATLFVPLLPAPLLCNSYKAGIHRAKRERQQAGSGRLTHLPSASGACCLCAALGKIAVISSIRVCLASLRGEGGGVGRVDGRGKIPSSQLHLSPPFALVLPLLWVYNDALRPLSETYLFILIGFTFQFIHCQFHSLQLPTNHLLF